MATETKKQLYDIREYADKVKASLAKLEQEKKPGEQVGKGGKSEVLLAAKDEIQKLIEKGYTAKQIAEALSGDDVFGILPKTITQLFATTVQKPNRTKQAARNAKKKKTQPAAPAAAAPKATDGKTPTEAGSLKIKKDSDDL
jgi:hypothetical protein